MIERLIHRLQLLHGGRRALVAFVAGSLGALAMPPIGFIPAMAVSLTLAVWLLDGAVGPRGRMGSALRQAFVIGWCYGFGYFLAGLWWVGSAFLVEADKFAWLMPFAVLLLPAGLAFFHAIGFALARLVWPAHPARILAFAAALGLLEYARGHLLTGFPWNALGYALGVEIHLAQILSIVGLYGLTTLTIAILAAPAALADEGRWRTGAPVLAALSLVALAGFGLWRLSGEPTALVEGVKLRLMQPSIPQDDKFRPSNREAIMQAYVSLSERQTGPSGADLSSVTHLIWPESAFPFIVSRDADALAQIGEMLPPGVTLLTGAGRADDPLSDTDKTRFFNALHVIDSSGAIMGSYDKVHLVPFGEYLPWQEQLEALGLRQLTQLSGGFTPGARRRTLEIPNAPSVAVLICYEAIFPGEVIDPAQRPGWMLNVTNDAWFGVTPGPYQHLLQARSRTIEEGLPLVRVANTGVSAVFDAKGREIARLSLNQTNVLDSPLPVSDPPTLYAQHRDIPFWMIQGILILIPLVARYRSRRLTGS
jgi:apolipoprotein N-acyltransferase